MNRRRSVLLVIAIVIAVGGLSAFLLLLGQRGGTLDVQIQELPPSAKAQVVVDGPGFHQVLTASRTGLIVTSGIYRFRASAVVISGNTYDAAPAAGSTTVASGRGSRLTVDYADLIPRTTKVLSLDKLVSPTVTPDSISAEGSPEALAGLRAGDVVVSSVSAQTPNGLVRKVIAVTTTDGLTTVRTGAATLRDAVPRGRFHIQAPLSARGFPAEQPTSDISEPSRTPSLTAPQRSSPSIRLVSSPGSSPTPSGAQSSNSEHEGFDWSGSCSVTGNTQEDAAFDIKPIVDFSADWSFLVLNRMQLKVGLQQDASASISADIAAECTFDGNTPSFRFDPITFAIGFVPVVVTPELSGEGEITGTTTIGGKLGAEENFLLDAGFLYDHGNLTFLHDAAPTLSWMPSIQPKASASVEAGPVLTMSVYTLGGPDINLRLGADANADSGGARITGTIGLRVGVHMAFLSFNIDKDFDLTLLEKPLATWGSPPSPTPMPSPTAAPNPGSATIAVTGGYSIQFSGPVTCGFNVAVDHWVTIGDPNGSRIDIQGGTLGRTELTLGSLATRVEVTRIQPLTQWIVHGPWAGGPAEGNGSFTFTDTGGSVDAGLADLGGGPGIHVVGQWTCP